MQKQRHFRSVNRRSEWEQEVQATGLLKVKEKKKVAIISEGNKTKQRTASVTSLISVISFSKLTISTVITNEPIKNKQYEDRFLSFGHSNLAYQNCASDFYFCSSQLFAPDRSLEMPSHRLTADH